MRCSYFIQSLRWRPYPALFCSVLFLLVLTGCELFSDDDDDETADISPLTEITVRATATQLPELSPKSLATITGKNLASSEQYASESPNKPLPLHLANISVTVNDRFAPLLSISPSRINFVVPEEVKAGKAIVEVRGGNGVVLARTLSTLVDTSPGLIASDTFDLEPDSFGDQVTTKALDRLADSQTYRLRLYLSGISSQQARLGVFQIHDHNQNPYPVSIGDISEQSLFPGRLVVDLDLPAGLPLPGRYTAQYMLQDKGNKESLYLYVPKSQDVSAKVQATVGNINYDDQSNVTSVDLRLQNTSDAPLILPLQFMVLDTGPENVALNSPDGLTEQGQPYYFIGSEDSLLASGEHTVPLSLQLQNALVDFNNIQYQVLEHTKIQAISPNGESRVLSSMQAPKLLAKNITIDSLSKDNVVIRLDPSGQLKTPAVIEVDNRLLNPPDALNVYHFVEGVGTAPAFTLPINAQQPIRLSTDHFSSFLLAGTSDTFDRCMDLLGLSAILTCLDQFIDSEISPEMGGVNATRVSNPPLTCPKLRKMYDIVLIGGFFADRTAYKLLSKWLSGEGSRSSFNGRPGTIHLRELELTSPGNTYLDNGIERARRQINRDGCFFTPENTAGVAADPCSNPPLCIKKQHQVPAINDYDIHTEGNWALTQCSLTAPRINNTEIQWNLDVWAQDRVDFNPAPGEGMNFLGVVFIPDNWGYAYNIDCEPDIDLDYDTVSNTRAVEFDYVFSCEQCSRDSDNDGVADGIDQCPGTPPDTRIDSVGCPLDCQGNDVCNGDPTFIQLPREFDSKRKKPVAAHKRELTANILVPTQGALVRAHVPVFGQAFGGKFKNYRLEYGAGENPDAWVVINSSTQAQVKGKTIDQVDDTANITIEGNLGTWDTGLKNYVYLPTHPRNHPVNHKGLYTIRLTVVGEDGSTAQDQVQVHVANVIPNAWGGRVISADGNFRLQVQEQSIRDAFRLIAAETVNAQSIPEPGGVSAISKTYRVLAAGEAFTKPAELNIALPDNYKERRHDAVLYAYNPEAGKWHALESYYRKNESGIFTQVQKLAPYYVLASAEKASVGAKPAPEQTTTAPRSQKVEDSSYLVKHTFDTNLHGWSNRDGDAGAKVSLHSSPKQPGSSLKLVNQHAGGNFAANVGVGGFDASRFPVLQFDYKLDKGVSLDLFLKVSNRWYGLQFSDSTNNVRNQRVNIAYIGKFHNITSDKRWHTTRINLYDALKTMTANTYVDAMVFADWDVTGYMKLVYGKNPKGAALNIDNFMIRKDPDSGLLLSGDVILDDFEQRKTSNHLGGRTETFVGPNASLKSNFIRTKRHGSALSLLYQSQSAQGYAGYISQLDNLDLRPYQALVFPIKYSQAEQLKLGFADRQGREHKVALAPFITGKQGEWRQVSIPLVVFTRELNWASMSKLVVGFEGKQQSAEPARIGEIHLRKYVSEIRLNDFSDRLAFHTNLLGFPSVGKTSGNAAINSRFTRNSPNGVLSLSFGGNIGEINVKEAQPFSYALWSSQLGGIDCKQCKALHFRIKGAKGGEQPHVYLDDGNFRWGVDIKDYHAVTTHWQNIRIPLSAYGDFGVDLSHLKELQIAFEWEEMSGTVYVDDIHFGE